MGLEVKYGGVNIGKYINVLKGFTPFSGPDWDVSLSDDGMRRGSEFEYITYKHKIIPMPFEISGDILEKYDKLCAALNVDEPKELIFSSVPPIMPTEFLPSAHSYFFFLTYEVGFELGT